MATLTIELKEDEGADEAVFNYVINRGLLTSMLKHYWGQSWYHDETRMADIAQRIGPMLPKGKQIMIAHDSSYCLSDFAGHGL